MLVQCSFGGAYGYPVASAKFLKTVLPLNYFCNFIKKKISVRLFLGFLFCSVDLHVYFLPNITLLTPWNLVEWFLPCHPFSKLFLAILVLLPFHINFRTILSISICWNFYKNCINLYIKVWIYFCIYFCGYQVFDICISNLYYVESSLVLFLNVL